MPARIDPETSSGFLLSLGGLSLQTLADQLKDNGGAIAAGATGAVGGSWAGPLGAVAGFVAGIGANLLSNCFQKRLEARKALRDFLTNEHLAHAQALCVQRRLLHFAAQCKRDKSWAAYADMIAALANDAPTWWLREVNNPAHVELEQLHDKAAVEQLTNYLKYENSTVLSNATWRALVGRAAAGMRDPKLEGDAILDAMAQTLAKHFKGDWVLALKNDFVNDGKAFAAISLRYLAEIHSALQHMPAFDKETQAVLREMPKLAKQLTKVRESLLEMDLPAQLRSMVLGTEVRLIDVVRDEGRRTRGLFTKHTMVILLALVVLGGVLAYLLLRNQPPRVRKQFASTLHLDTRPGGQELPNYPPPSSSAELIVHSGNYQKILSLEKGMKLPLYNIPDSLRGKWFTLQLKDDHWRTVDDSMVIAVNDPIVPLEPNGILERVNGVVVGMWGKGVPNMRVSLNGDTTFVTDSVGEFSGRLHWRHQRERHNVFLVDFPAVAGSTYLPRSSRAEIIFDR